MARSKTLPDSAVHAEVLRLLRADGETGLSFGAVARACGLAPATLVQRFGSQPGMVHAALVAGWSMAHDAVEPAEKAAGKNAAKLLKALPVCADLRAASRRDAALRELAEGWRLRVQAALAVRLGGGNAAAEKAAMLFALWQGQGDWEAAGGKGFKLKDAVKRLA